MNDPAAPVLDRATELLDDLNFESVKEWKAKNPGGLAIGTLPVYVPRPLLTAMGCLPVSIFGGGDQIDVVRGDAYFQSYICHIPRSVIEMLASGRLDVLDGVLLPSTCDVIRNLGGMWQTLKSEQLVEYVDLPQNLNHDTGGKFYVRDIERIANALERRGALELTDARLRAAIEVENRRREAIERMDEVRKNAPWSLRASEVYLVMRAGSVIEVEAHIEMIDSLLDAVKRREVPAYDNVRVVLVGSFCEQPPIGLLRSLEKSGCDIVWDDLQLNLRYIDGPIELVEGRSALDSLGHAYLEKGTPTSSRYIGDAKKGQHLIDTVKTHDAHGVIFAAASFCDPALLDQPMQEAALEAANIPYTSFKFAENTGQFQVIREQAGAFSDSVKLWGTA